MARLRPVGYEDRLSLVDHLDELRTRLIWCLLVLVACFTVTYWQHDALLNAVNKPFYASSTAGATRRTRSAGQRARPPAALFYRRLDPCWPASRTPCAACAAPSLSAADRAPSPRRSAGRPSCSASSPTRPGSRSPTRSDAR